MDRETKEIGKLLLCIQGMMHKLETKEGEEMDSKKAAAERARQLHTRYRAFTAGDFASILDQDNQKEDKGPTQPKKHAQKTKLGGNFANNRDADPPEGPTLSSPTSGTATWAKRPRP